MSLILHLQGQKNFNIDIIIESHRIVCQFKPVIPLFFEDQVNCHDYSSKTAATSYHDAILQRARFNLAFCDSILEKISNFLDEDHFFELSESVNISADISFSFNCEVSNELVKLFFDYPTGSIDAILDDESRKFILSAIDEYRHTEEKVIKHYQSNSQAHNKTLPNIKHETIDLSQSPLANVNEDETISNYICKIIREKTGRSDPEKVTFADLKKLEQNVKNDAEAKSTDGVNSRYFGSACSYLNTYATTIWNYLSFFPKKPIEIELADRSAEQTKSYTRRPAT